MNFVPKTGRRYGLIFAAVRAVAAQQRQFTRADVGLPRMQFNNAVQRLIAEGELRRVQPGRNGRGYKLAVYSKS
jgi:hypothetical protein